MTTETASTAAGATARQAVIQVEGLSIIYGRNRALDNVTASFPPGAVGLLGPNGAGKSSLLKALLGFLTPTQGTARVLDMDVAARPLDVRQAVGYMPEIDCHIPGMNAVAFTAYLGQLCGMPRIEAMQRAHEALYYVGLGDERYRNVETYSTGMKQRIKLAQALVHDPPVLLLDEPTSGLDPSGRDAMLRLLLTIAREHGKSFILSTHLLGDVERVCDTVVILHHGQVLRQGGVAELRTRRQDRYRLQIQGEPNAFLEELRLEGVRVVHDNGRGELRVAVPQGWVTRAFFALADNHGVLLRGLQPDDEDLEELFHRVLSENGRDGR